MGFLNDFFGRGGRVVRGQANQAMSAVENANFEATVKQAILDMRTELNNTVRASASAMANYNRLETEYQKYVRQSQDWKARASEALDADPPLALAVLAQVAFAEEDAGRAARLAREAADAAEAAGFAWWRGVTLLGASEGLLVLGELETAQKFFAEGLDVLRSVRDLVNLPIALAAGAALAAQLGDAARAGTLWGALEAQAEREPRQTTIENQTEYEPYLEPVLGAAFEEARLHGRTLSLEEAVAYALGEPT